MLRLIGTILVVGASAALGISARQRLVQRVRVLEQLIESLHRIAAELDERQTPFPELIGWLAQEGGPDSRKFFAEMQRRIRTEDGLSFPYRWQTTARDMAPELGLADEETAVLRDAAAYLGRYQAEQQLFGLRHTSARLEAIHAQAVRDLQAKGSVYRVCGIAAGVVAVLMML